MTTEMSRDAWKYTLGPKPEDLKKNKYLHPPDEESPKPLIDASILSTNKDFLTIGPIECYRSDGTPFEQYEKVSVSRDVSRTDVKCAKNPTVLLHEKFTPLEAIVHFEAWDMLLPSFALSCAIIVWCYNHRTDSTALAILEQYKNYGSGDGYYAQNTIINSAKGVVIHYPHEFEGKHVNQDMFQCQLPFPARGKQKFLEEALKYEKHEESLKNLTGLKKPEVLIDVAKYFSKRAVFLPTNSPHIIPAFLGCAGGFCLYADDVFNYYDGARGVRVKTGVSK